MCHRIDLLIKTLIQKLFFRFQNFEPRCYYKKRCIFRKNLPGSPHFPNNGFFSWCDRLTGFLANKNHLRINTGGPAFAYISKLSAMIWRHMDAVLFGTPGEVIFRKKGDADHIWHDVPRIRLFIYSRGMSVTLFDVDLSSYLEEFRFVNWPFLKVTQKFNF